jgi:anaerobic ribonucleoside-triphosphate reductase
MDVGQGYKANENANLQPNAETSHKRKADWVSGEEYLLLMPPKLADAHLVGDLHIHDLEYFGTRPFREHELDVTRYGIEGSPDFMSHGRATCPRADNFSAWTSWRWA